MLAITIGVGIEMFIIDPLTLTIKESDKKEAYSIVKSEIKRKFENLKDFNDWLSDLLDEKLRGIPADTRFPGFFSSISDHAKATSAVAVPLALELCKKVDFSAEYEGYFSGYIKNRENLKEVIRTASLLHDIGKHPPQDHYKRSRKEIEEILSVAGFSDLAKQIAELASKHHYRGGIEEEYLPQRKLEWVIAIADKVAVHDRILWFFDLEPYEWLRANLKGQKELDEFIEKARKDE